MRARLLPLAALGTLAVYLAIAIFLALDNAALRLRAAARTAGLAPTAVRSRVFGPRYVAGIDRIRRAIPLDEPYLLAEQDTPGAMLWVRFDLLPRRAVVIGPPQARTGDCWLPQVRWVVVGVATGRPPVLLEQRPSLPAGCPAAPWAAPGGGAKAAR
jgi:hypothetical protein